MNAKAAHITRLFVHVVRVHTFKPCQQIHNASVDLGDMQAKTFCKEQLDKNLKIPELPTQIDDKIKVPVLELVAEM